MVLQDKKVAVIGAGPVGLTFAKLLQQSGVGVHVYERDRNQHTRIKGGTLDIHHDYGQLALEKAGLLDEFYRYSRPTPERSTGQDGTLLEEDDPAEGHLYDRPEIDRNDLRTILLEHLDPGTVVWDSKLTSLEQQQDGTFLLHFENGDTVAADLVVGANGGMSNVRKLVTDAHPEYTGTMVIQGEVLQPDLHCPDFKQLCGQGNMAAIAEQMFVFSQTKANGALNYYISFRRPEQWIRECGLDFTDKKAVSAYLDQLFANWNPVYRQLFSATDEYTLLPMRRLRPENWKPHHNITLIGDAAHVMPPFSGIGVNIGLLDALYLSENLLSKSCTDINAAIQAYEAQMFAYASKAQEDTAEAESSIHSEKRFDEIRREKRESGKDK